MNCCWYNCISFFPASGSTFICAETLLSLCLHYSFLCFFWKHIGVGLFSLIIYDLLCLICFVYNVWSLLLFLWACPCHPCGFQCVDLFSDIVNLTISRHSCDLLIILCVVLFIINLQIVVLLAPISVHSCSFYILSVILCVFFVVYFLSMSVNTIPLYFLPAISSWCIVLITSAGMGSTVQSLRIIHIL